jgi:mRNA interferase RelE/StbE
MLAHLAELPIVYSKEALRTLTKIDRATAARIVLKVEQLARDPLSLGNNVTALKGGDGLKRLRVGDWRVIFQEGVVLDVVRVAPRGSAYG